MGTQRHAILRQTVELAVPRQADAWPLQQEAARIVRRLRPVIERHLDELSAPDRLHRIERLELDLGRLDPARLEEELSAKFGEALRRELAGQIRRQESAALSPKTAAQLELFSQFVRQGSLPWWADPARPGQPQESLDWLLREAPGLLPRLLPGLAADGAALRRLASQFEARPLAGLVLLLAPALGGFPAALAEVLAGLPSLAATPPARLKSRIWQGILGTAAPAPRPPEDRLDFSRAVLMRLARLLGLAHPALVRDFARAAAASAGEVASIAAALAEERGLAAGPGRPQAEAKTGEGAAYPAPWKGGAALEELRTWLEAGGADAGPPWLRAWPASLRKALAERLGSPAAGLAARLEELRAWLERGAPGPGPAWLRGWPPPLREEFAAQLRGGAAARPGRADEAGLAGQWREALEQARFSEAGALYPGNAGLVILWPFLKTFFDRAGLLRENGFADEAARQRGAALLHCLATGDAGPPEEHLLPLNKLLCGMEPGAVFEPERPLAEEEAAECEKLLEAAIAQAPILNGMSVRGFRGSFLLRAGVLEARDGAWLLRVERETYDLVLDRLPWGFQWVKLPWMDAPLQVEW